MMSFVDVSLYLVICLGVCKSPATINEPETPFLQVIVDTTKLKIKRHPPGENCTYELRTKLIVWGKYQS